MENGHRKTTNTVCVRALNLSNLSLDFFDLGITCRKNKENLQKKTKINIQLKQNLFIFYPPQGVWLAGGQPNGEPGGEEGGGASNSIIFIFMFFVSFFFYIARTFI